MLRSRSKARTDPRGRVLAIFFSHGLAWFRASGRFGLLNPGLIFPPLTPRRVAAAFLFIVRARW
jgi:hypothetical protein